LEVVVVFEFAQQAGNFIHVTALYSNAVLVALLPHFSDFAQKLDLPVTLPLKAESVVGFSPVPWLDKDGGIGGGGIVLKGGYRLSFQFGFVNWFEGPHSYYALQDPDQIPKFFGTTRMSRDETVKMARQILRKLGIPLELVFAEQEPEVTVPVQVGTNTVPHYRIVWKDIWPGGRSVDIEIDAETRRLEALKILNLNLQRPSPKVAVVPPLRNVPSNQVNPVYARKLLPIVLLAVDEYIRTLSLPVSAPLNTNLVERFIVADNGGWPSSFLKLSNGWWFVYRNNMVSGFYAPGNLTSLPQYQGRVLIKDVAGKWNLTETQAVQLVSRAMAKLHYPSNLVHMDFQPTIGKPAIPGIPRYALRWRYTPPSLHSEKEGDVDFGLQSKIEAEVDADKGELKALYYDDMAYWNHPPPIDVPISISAEMGEPRNKQSDQRQRNESAKKPLRSKPSRPQSDFNSPIPK
jgi:hypothetical protein